MSNRATEQPSNKSSNKNLRKARKVKNDEFYTQLPDIENELKHYKQHFKDKVVYCNCDDPSISNFFRYFSLNFKWLGLKKLITTCYKNQDVDLFSENKSEQAIYIEYKGKQDEDSSPVPDEVDIKFLKGNGDFRSKECIELLKQADIVVTNPPFSLFGEYLAQLMEYDKKFIIIGNINAISYKECFEAIKGNKMWLGYNKVKEFKKPDGTTQKFGNVGWFTNLDVKNIHEDLPIFRIYKGNERNYPKYDNYNAINVDKTIDIPIDYKGVMGVPISFLDKYNPEQFELLGIMNHGDINKGIRYEGTPHGRPIINGVEKYSRVLIKNKKI